MNGLTNAGGGNVAGPIKNGTIVVSYPPGAICTVSNGARTYTALDKSGSAAFTVPSGTWLVKAGELAQSVRVLAGDWAAVELNTDLPLYAAGMSSGLTAVATPSETGMVGKALSISYNADSVTLAQEGSGGNTGIAHFDAVDLTNYSELRATLTAQNIDTAYYPTANGVFFWQTVPGITTNYVAAAAAMKSIDNSTTEISLDVAALTGAYYIGFGLRRGSPGVPSINLTDLRLRK